MFLGPVESRSAAVGVPNIEIDNVTTIIDGNAVLYRLNLDVPAGQVTVLMGPSGAGKTTLIKHIVGLVEPAGGTVRIGGRDVWDASDEQFRTIVKGIGAMLGGSNLFSISVFTSLSVLSNLTATLTALGVPQRQRYDRAVARLRELGLSEMRDLLPGQLPGHAIKRLALARALVADAPVTVLDEIDIGVDQEHSAAILEAIGSLRRRTGCTLLVTTHNLELARSLADHVAILVNGRIVACGPPGDILDGIASSGDFDRRFEFSDYLGPPRLRDAVAAADRQLPPSNKTRRLAMYSRILWIAVIVGISIVILTVGIKIYTGETY